VDYIKKFIDRLAMQKLNKFHWHLIDGHGWRLEIKKYPRLTEVGAWRPQPPIGRYGGFYTQEQVKEIVKYAADRHITIIPEVEMPGHSRAAIASYPELSCSKIEGPVGIFYDYPCAEQRFPPKKNADVFCASSEKVYQFLEDVLKETFELFPSKYIHIGGDEVQKKYWKQCSRCQEMKKTKKLKNEHEIQSHFIKRMEKFINANGRRLIGWDEILEGGLAPNATVMSWRGIKGGIKSAKMGHDVVMSPGKPLYFDHAQSRHPSHPAHWPGVETLKEVYDYNPIPEELTPKEARHILGAQANLWTVFIHTPELYDVQTYPRQFALSETVWTPLESKNWEDYLKRQETALKRLDIMNISYWIEPETTPVADWTPEMCTTTSQSWTFNLTEKLTEAGPFDLFFQYQKGRHRLHIKEVKLLENGKTISIDKHQGTTGGASRHNRYRIKLEPLKPDAEYKIKALVHTDGGTNSYGTVSLSKAGGKTWYKAPKIKPSSAIQPVTQNRDKMYNWKERHNRCTKFVKENNPDILFIGDSITHYWGSEPSHRYKCAPQVWNKYFGGLETANLGFGWDRTENVLWRIKNGALAGTQPKLAVMMIGTNNLDFNTAQEIADGIKTICNEIGKQSPKTKILLVGILPRLKAHKVDPEAVNLLTSFLHHRDNITYININYGFIDHNGKVKKALFRDEVHPNAKGYKVIGSSLRPVIDKLLK
jgi:lysophospholipase L1-like esterase